MPRFTGLGFIPPCPSLGISERAGIGGNSNDVATFGGGGGGMVFDHLWPLAVTGGGITATLLLSASFLSISMPKNIEEPMITINKASISGLLIWDWFSKEHLYLYTLIIAYMVVFVNRGIKCPHIV